jgi:Zn finger protein HypA/HybF involved in hydrogenase expression
MERMGHTQSMLECKQCNERFITIIKTGEITCPKCGVKDNFIRTCFKGLYLALAGKTG